MTGGADLSRTVTRARRRPGRSAAIAAAVAILTALVMLILPLAQTPARADVDDFWYDSISIDYTLGVDEEGRSTLVTRETLVAQFPEFDQNRGIIRDLPRVYDGHDTELEILGIKDERGMPRGYSTDRSGDTVSVTIAVPEGSYVHGEQTYVIEYAQRDVTRFFDDTGVDEFYWDLNGTEWRQPFDRLDATLHLEGDLAERLTGDTACYRGGFGSSDTCALERTGDGFEVHEIGLMPRENVTIAIGFEPETFAEAPVTPGQFLARVPIAMWSGIVLLAGGIGTWCFAFFRARRSGSGRAIIAQYEPPEGVDVPLAAELIGARRKMMTATMLDFAVRRKLRLLHDGPSGMYGVQQVPGAELTPAERITYTKLFDRQDPKWFSPEDTSLGDAAAGLRVRTKRAAKRSGLTREPAGWVVALVIALPILALGCFIVQAVLSGGAGALAVVLGVGINLIVWLEIALLMLLFRRRGVTAAGAPVLDHLLGLKEFIRLAEADRIRMLQSATGAEVGEDRIVQIYELLLPYAVLFGFETEWQGELAKYYRESTPDWVYGEGSFVHAMPISAFDRHVSSAPRTQTSNGSGSGGSFSSFSGGSSGGGFSGGGGGGGGGRGI